MSYTANFETAKIYADTGLKVRAKEYLEKVVNDVPECERKAGNVVYLKALSMLARIALEESDRARSAEYIDAGLRVKHDHADLLFLKALLFWDIQRYDEMFLTLMIYLGALFDESSTSFDYEYAERKVVAEAIYKLLPEAFSRSEARPQLAKAIAEKAGMTDNAMIKLVNKVLQETDGRGEEAAAGSGLNDSPK